MSAHVELYEENRALTAELVAREREITRLDAYTAELAGRVSSLEIEREALLKLLEEAVIDIQDWGQYAGDYFQKKHDLAGTISAYRLAIAARREA